VFTEKEIAYRHQQRLARIATALGSGRPDVAPVGQSYDRDYFYISGRDLSATYKYKNIQLNGQVALLVDDLASVQSWWPRGIQIHGRADIVERETGYLGAGTYIRVKPERQWSWGIV
jgi:pyridoxamine 5'-phosphate oxidase family protein